ncbi:MAG: glycogen debranching protein, partial [Bacteroidota bacterium]
PLGWHDRARKHFSSYALSQLTAPPVMGVVMDTALHLARHLEKIGTALFSDGYISRNPNDSTHAHHYDMNLVFVDELLDHFNWTGDTNYVRKMFPLIKRHLAWEKRNFDADGDGLYDAYAAIWASDALQYSGGDVTHSSAYNYRANKMAAELAILIGEDPAPYKKEADKILSAINKQLWMPQKGWYAEYKDLLGNKLLHPYPGLWTIYHAIDSKVPDAFQAYQSLKYIDNNIPHIPVLAEGLSEKNLYLLSTTNWQPYTWSLNNVVLAENLHTSLAYWQGNEPEQAYHLWRSALIESMYLSASPGNFEQLSFYDAVRGELYRDFADPIGVAARTLVEGLFGVQPDALHNTLIIQPGLPMQWNNAFLSVPDISIDFKKNKNQDHYTIIPTFMKNLQLKFRIRARLDSIESIIVNGKKVSWQQLDNAVERPVIQIDIPYSKMYRIVITWKGKEYERPSLENAFNEGEAIDLQYKNAELISISDSQQALREIKKIGNKITARVQASEGNKTFFTEIKQGQFTYWQPFSFKVKKNIVMDKKTGITAQPVFEKTDLTHYFNDKVNNIFKHQYLSPRPTSPTLQLPTQGIGNWAYPLATANINDSGLRKLAGDKNEISSPHGIPFSTPSDSMLNNIAFTSQWDNFPKEVTVTLNGKASHVYLLMAGSTDPMQSRITNGLIIVTYNDDTKDTLKLINPQNWWPIEQDYINDGYAFTTDALMPLRLYLKDGKFSYGLKQYSVIKGFTNMAIDGGAATLLEMPIDISKELKSLTVKTLANDVIIGLMSVSLQRN